MFFFYFFTQSNSRTSPIAKSLPSYDEALKRVNGDTKATKIHVLKSSLSPICVNASTSSKSINNNTNNICNNINNKSSEHLNSKFCLIKNKAIFDKISQFSLFLLIYLTLSCLKATLSFFFSFGKFSKTKTKNK